jgi:hypothetical protein
MSHSNGSSEHGAMLVQGAQAGPEVRVLGTCLFMRLMSSGTRWKTGCAPTE